MDRMFVNLDRYGNTSAASIPIALAEAVDSGRVKVGDQIVIVAFGAGFTSGAAAIEWTADPARGALAEIDPAGGRRPSGCRSTGTRSTRSRPRSPRSSPGPIVPGVELDLDDVVPGEPEHGAEARGGPRVIDSDGQVRARDRRRAWDRPGHRPAPGDPGRRRGVQLPRQRRRGRRDGGRGRGARPAGARRPGRRQGARGRGAVVKRPPSRPSARSTSSSTTPGSPATTSSCG